MSTDKEDYSGMITAKVKEIAREVSIEELNKCQGIQRGAELDRRVTAVENDIKNGFNAVYEEIKCLGNKQDAQCEKQDNKWFQLLLICIASLLTNIGIIIALVQQAMAAQQAVPK